VSGISPVVQTARSEPCPSSEAYTTTTAALHDARIALVASSGPFLLASDQPLRLQEIGAVLHAERGLLGFWWGPLKTCTKVSTESPSTGTGRIAPTLP
jgi:hypothetical protein